MDVAMRLPSRLFALAIAFSSTALADDRWWGANEHRIFPAELSYPNDIGVITTLNATGPTETWGHPFFSAIGANGRACVTCHQPADAMSLSAATAQERWHETNGKDPL